MKAQLPADKSRLLKDSVSSAVNAAVFSDNRYQVSATPLRLHQHIYLCLFAIDWRPSDGSSCCHGKEESIGSW